MSPPIPSLFFKFKMTDVDIWKLYFTISLVVFMIETWSKDPHPCSWWWRMCCKGSFDCIYFHLWCYRTIMMNFVKSELQVHDILPIFICFSCFRNTVVSASYLYRCELSAFLLYYQFKMTANYTSKPSFYYIFDLKAYRNVIWRSLSL